MKRYDVEKIGRQKDALERTTVVKSDKVTNSVQEKDCGKGMNVWC